MNPNDPKPKLTPLPGAKIPLPAGNPAAAFDRDKQLAAEIEHLAKAEANTLAVLAHGMRATAESNEVIVALLQDLRDIMVKVCQSTGMPLPARLQAAIDKKEYNPDEPDDDEEDDAGEEGEDSEGDGDVLAQP